jgi:phenylalanyl-tRNA synthetase beta subunit
VVGKTEEQRLAFALRDEKISFADARGYLQTFMKEQRRAFELRKEDAPPWLDAEESGRLWVEGIGSGWLGRVHSRIAASGGLEGQVYICEVLV